jgi:solute carrier family 25 iron transporter 28/37
MESSSLSSSPIVESRPSQIEEDLEWEEWDGKIPFWTHCLAGGIAGISEHTLLYPIDTVKTHMQSYCATCPHQAAASSASSRITSTASAAASSPSSHLRSGGGNLVLSSSSSSSPLGMWRTFTHLIYPTSDYSSTSRTSAAAAAPPSPPNYSYTQRIQHTTAAVGLVDDVVAAEAAGAAARRSSSPSLARLFRGMQTMVVGCAPAHALYFSSYEIVKQFFTSSHGTTSHTTQHLSTMGSMAAGATATFFHDSIMTPLDTMKQRLQLGHYDGKMITAFRSIVQMEGIPGLYRSLGITLGTNVPYGMLTVTINEKFRELLAENTTFTPTQIFMASGCGAGCIASAMTTPLDRIKTRLQVQSMGANVDAICTAAHQPRPCAVVSAHTARYHGFWDAYCSIVREEGYVGLWRGTLPRVISQTPAVAISWTAYETVKSWLLSD